MTAKAALAHGAVVTIAGRSAQRLRRAKATLGETRAVEADATKEADVERLSASLTASIMSLFPPVELAMLQYDVDQRFWGSISVARHAVPRMSTGSVTCLSGQLGCAPCCRCRRHLGDERGRRGAR